MTEFNPEHHLGSFKVDGVNCEVYLELTYDGLEYKGRLWFNGDAVEGKPIPDHGSIPGRTREEAIEFARRFNDDDLLRRLFRAKAEKRKYLQLRAATNTFLEKVKYMNRVALSMKAGMLDAEGARRELDLVVEELHQLVDTLPLVAGVEESS